MSIQDKIECHQMTVDGEIVYVAGTYGFMGDASLLTAAGATKAEAIANLQQMIEERLLKATGPMN